MKRILGLSLSVTTCFPKSSSTNCRKPKLAIDRSSAALSSKAELLKSGTGGGGTDRSSAALSSKDELLKSGTGGGGRGGMGTRCMEAVTRWQQEHQEELAKAKLEILTCTETSIQFRSGGVLLELVLPGGLFVDGAESEDGILAISTDDSAPGQLLEFLNEKLERVRKTSAAVPGVLDLVLQTLRDFVGKSNALGRTSKVDGLRGVNDGRYGRTRGNDSSATRGGTAAANKGTLDLNRSHGSDVNHPIFLSDSEEEWDRKIEDSDEEADRKIYDSDEESDDGLYGGFDGFDEDCDFTLAIPDGNNLRISTEVEEARIRCELARTEDDRPQSSFAPSGSTSSPALFGDEILKYCKVTAIPSLNCVRIRAEVSGIVSSVRVATALGFTAQGTLQISLEPDGKFWKPEGSFDACKVDRVTVQLLDNVDKEQPDSRVGGESCSVPGWKNGLPVFGQATCTTIMLQELISSFFDRRAAVRAESVSPPQREQGLLEQEGAEFKNPLIGLMCFLGSQLRGLPGYCVSCWSPLPSSAGRIRTCQKELCLFKFEEVGLGAMAVLEEIKESPSVIDFELSAGCAAVDFSRDVFEPFPAFLLRNKEIRGRSGFFSDASRMALPTGPVHHNTPRTKSENKRLTDLLAALQSIPKTVELLRCANESELKEMLTSAASGRSSSSLPKEKNQDAERECNEMMLSYKLLRFILSTNRLSLVELQLDKLPCSVQSTYQFIALSDFPEKEARFTQRKRAKGSFFAFHGSNSGNWYSIMRNGLKSLSRTAFMSNGAAHGEGIYLSSSFSYSYSYAQRATKPSWGNGGLAAGMSVIAICEVINGSCQGGQPAVDYSTAYVVPRINEDDVAVRYIIVVGASSNFSPTNANYVTTNDQGYIKGSIYYVDKSQASQTPIDLEKHYADIKLKHSTALWARLEDERKKATLRLKEENIRGHLWKERHRQSEEAVENQRQKATPMEVTTTSYSGAPAAEHRPRSPSRAKRPREDDKSDAAPAKGATQAVAREFKNVLREIQRAKADEFLTHVEVTIPDETNLNVWNISLSQDLFKSAALLHKDLTAIAKTQNDRKGNILMEAIFPSQYPFAPPFIRIVRPKFMFHTGHVTVGGSICMELLTASGWLPSFSFESVLVQIVNAMVEGGGRLELRSAGGGYSREEAQSAFTRVALAHNWKVSSYIVNAQEVSGIMSIG